MLIASCNIGAKYNLTSVTCDAHMQEIRDLGLSFTAFSQKHLLDNSISKVNFSALD